MQPTGTGTAGGVGELSRGCGLTRFRSAPETWLEVLLESEEEDEVVLDALKPPNTHSLSQLLLNNSSSPTPTPTPTDVSTRYPDSTLFNAAVPSSGTGFHRQNSSSADLLAQISSSGSDAYFSNFGGPAKYDSISSSLDVSPSGKRSREVVSEHPSHKFSSQVKGEQSSQLHGGMGGMLDAEMEKLLEDSVPCRVRAKRGCATHPRSIAERVRRTRISDRIRKLQELVPNMDKQTNTADMLEEAVEYVKFLQGQIQELTEHQKKCTCAIKE